MTKIADFDLLKLPIFFFFFNVIVTSENLGIFNTFKCRILSKNQNSEPQNDPNCSFKSSKIAKLFDFTYNLSVTN